MARLRYNGLSTTLGGSGLASGATTAVTFGAALTYNGGTSVPTISGSDYIPLSILDSTGKLAEIVYLTAYTSGGTTGTIARAKEGTSAAARASGLKVVQAPTTSDAASGILAIATATTSAAYSTTATSSVAMDATNLTVTFTAPASGAVYITQTGYATTSSTTTGAYEWSVITTGGTEVQVCAVAARQNTLSRRIATYYLTGLTAGTSYTYQWGHRVGGAITGTTYTGGNAGTNGDTIMTVHAA